MFSIAIACLGLRERLGLDPSHVLGVIGFQGGVLWGAIAAGYNHRAINSKTRR